MSVIKSYKLIFNCKMPGFSDKLEGKGQKVRCKKIIYCKDLAQIFIMTN